MNEPIHLAAEALASLEVSQSFEAFYDAESRTLFRRLWLVTGNRAEAEELMQDAFLKVWERWEQVGAMEDPVGYLPHGHEPVPVTQARCPRPDGRAGESGNAMVGYLSAANGSGSGEKERETKGVDQRLLAKSPPRL